jgi:hypothetical protein
MMYDVLVKLNPELLWQKRHLTRRGGLFTGKMDLELSKKQVKCYIWSIALHGAETWTLRTVDQKHLESFEMWLLEKEEEEHLDRS